MPEWALKYLQTQDPTVGILLVLLVGLFLWSERRWVAKDRERKVDREQLIKVIQECTVAHVNASAAIYGLSGATDRLAVSLNEMERQRAKDSIEAERQRAKDLVEIIRVIRERPNGWDKVRS